MDYQMIVLDLDGTLTNKDKIITHQTKQALMAIQQQGKTVVLASGRPTQGIVPLAKELELERYGGYVLSFNGGLIVNCQTQEVVFSSQIPVTANQKIIALAKTEGVSVLTYRDDVIYTDVADDIYVQRESQINGLPLVEIEDMEKTVDFPVVKFLMVGDGDRLAEVEPKVKLALGEQFSVYRSEPFFLEILTQGIDKAKSLSRLLKQLKLDQSQMIACGDGYNDLSMIQYAGLGVAMANAVPPVKAAADYITYSNDDDGIVHVIEKFMLC